MSGIRTLVGGAVVVIITLGYLASVYAALTGSAADYAQKIDQPPVKYLALVVLVAAVLFALIPERKEPGK